MMKVGMQSGWGGEEIKHFPQTRDIIVLEKERKKHGVLSLCLKLLTTLFIKVHESLYVDYKAFNLWHVILALLYTPKYAYR